MKTVLTLAIAWIFISSEKGFTVYTRDGKKTKLKRNGNIQIAILKTGYGCKSCFTKLDSIIYLLGVSDKTCCISLSENNPATIALSDKEERRLMPHLNFLYYEYCHKTKSGSCLEKKGGVFKFANTLKSPTLLLFSRDSVRVILFEKIFDPDGDVNNDLKSLLLTCR